MVKRAFIYSWVMSLVCAGALTAQSIRINRVNLEAFPRIRLTVSVETLTGQALPVDTRALELLEGGLPVKKFQARPLDSLSNPVYTVIAIDKSGSMKGEPLGRAKKAAIDYIGLMEGNDHCGYIEFDTQVTVAAGFSNDSALLTERVNRTVAGSDTAFLDAVYRGIGMLAEAPDNAARVVLVLTDGLDNRSSNTLESLIEAAAGSGVAVYTIGLGTQIHERTLRRLAADTNGNYYFSPGAETLSGIYKTISHVLHSRLEVEYETLFPMDQEWHAVQIRVPHKGKILMAERQYLSARESRIPSDMLRRMRAQKKKKAQEDHIRQLVLKQKKEQLIIIILAGILCLLVLILVMVLWKRRRRLS